MAFPQFLTLAEVIEIHADQLERYGGHPGIRDLNLLKSAVAQPQAGTSAGYLHADIQEMAAAYLFHIVQNHPFIDGNKRVGAMAAYIFLRLNDVEIAASESKYEALARKVADGKESKQGIAKFFSRNTKTLRQGS